MTDTTAIVVETVEVVSIESVEIGQQGPPGPRGEIGPSGGAAFEVMAGENLSSYRAVRVVDGLAHYCDGDDAGCAGSCVGITKTAGLSGALVEVQAIGKFIDPTFAFTEGPLFVGTNGALSATPGTAFVQEIARAMSSTSLFVNIQPSILKV